MLAFYHSLGLAHPLVMMRHKESVNLHASLNWGLSQCTTWQTLEVTCWHTAAAKFPPALSPEIAIRLGSTEYSAKTSGCKKCLVARRASWNCSGKHTSGTSLYLQKKRGEKQVLPWASLSGLIGTIRYSLMANNYFIRVSSMGKIWGV